MQHIEYHRIIRMHLSTAYLLSEEKIDSVLPGFLESLETLMHTLEQVADTENNEAISRAGHALKGALLSLGLMDLAEKAFTIEKNCMIGEGEWDSSGFIADLKEEIAKIF